jgi:hypothetical protein
VIAYLCRFHNPACLLLDKTDSRFPPRPQIPAESRCSLDHSDHFRHNQFASVAALRLLIGIAKLVIGFTEKP